MLALYRRPFEPSHFQLPLCDHRAGSRTLVSPGRGQNADCLVIPRQAVDAGFNQDEAELRVFVLAVTLEVFADSNGLNTQMSLTVHRSFERCKTTFLINM